MTNVDEFSRVLLEEAKRFFERAVDEKSDEGKTAYLHGALILGFCALEAHVNAIADDFLVRDELRFLKDQFWLKLNSVSTTVISP